MGMRLLVLAYVFSSVFVYQAFFQGGKETHQTGRAFLAQVAPQAEDPSEVPAEWLFGWGADTTGHDFESHSCLKAASQPFIACEKSRIAAWKHSCSHDTCLVRKVPGASIQQATVLRQVRGTAADVCPTRQSASLEGEQNVSPRRRWQEDWPAENRTQSPRRRASPRRKGKDSGLHAQKGGKGQPSVSDRGKGKGVAPEKRTAPTVKDLPKPPEVHSIPRPTSAVKSEATEERPSGASALLSQLVASRESLPREVQALVDKEMKQDAKANTKQLHRLVSQQGSARRELQSIYKMRAFLLEWTSYICQLCTLVEKQLQAKAATLQELDQAEEAWQTQLAQATSSIAQASGVVPTPSVETGEPIDLETEQEDAEQAVANAAAEASKKHKMLAELELQEKSISAALAQARTAANESVEALRQRTPTKGAKADGKVFI